MLLCYCLNDQFMIPLKGPAAEKIFIKLCTIKYLSNEAKFCSGFPGQNCLLDLSSLLFDWSVLEKYWNFQLRYLYKFSIYILKDPRILTCWSIENHDSKMNYAKISCANFFHSKRRIKKINFAFLSCFFSFFNALSY